MAQKPTHHVVPSGDVWKVKREGSTRATSIHETQSEAIASATGTARERGEGSVVIHRPSGEIREERTYGKDPERTKG